MAFACAHRGLSAEHPENSLPAFGAAVAAGFGAVELDLRTTKDGELVILHDLLLDRTTDGKGPVALRLWSEVQGLTGPGGAVPRLADLLRMLKAWDGLYNLEVKAAAATAPTLKLVREFGLEGRVQLSSMDPAVLAAAQKSDPGIPRGYIPLGPIEPDDLDAAATTGCAWVNADHDFLDADEVAGLRAAGYKVAAWTVNEPARAKELAAMGVACIITDTRAVHAALGSQPAAW